MGFNSGFKGLTEQHKLAQFLWSVSC